MQKLVSSLSLAYPNLVLAVTATPYLTLSPRVSYLIISTSLRNICCATTPPTFYLHFLQEKNFKTLGSTSSILPI